MISIGACGIWESKQFPDWIESFSYKNIQNLKWMYDYQTGEDQIRVILDQFPNYNSTMSDEEIKRIETRTLIVLGDQDKSVPLETVRRVRQNLPHSFLWIVPKQDMTHIKAKTKMSL
jgi:pimeloyl-ACP methyl ester carboxylesterase